MAMGGGGGTGKAVSDINVTPLIDVLLVLLIIFMVIVPVTPHGLNTLVPQPPKNKDQQESNDRTIVVQVLANGKGEPSYKINEDTFAKSAIEPKLAEICAVGPSRPALPPLPMVMAEAISLIGAMRARTCPAR